MPDTVIHNKSQYLLTKVAEEATEIAKAATKSLTFGIDNYNPMTPKRTNADDIMMEFYHLDAMIEMLQKEGILPILTKEEEMKIKKEKKYKVNSYMKEYEVE